MQLRDFIPPIVRRITPRFTRPTLREYRSHDEALAESDSYQAPDIVDVVLRKTEIYRDQITSLKLTHINSQTVQNLFVLSYVQPDRPLNVLEIGGACGANYFELAHLLPERIASWRIVETSAMAARARQALHHPAPGFFDNLMEAVSEMGRRDLLIAQGVLQYMPQPFDKFDELLALNFEYVYVSRTLTLMNTLSDVRVIFNAESRLSEHGPGLMPAGFTDRRVTTPCTLVSDTLLNARIGANYRKELSFDESKPQAVTIGSRNLELKTVGFLLHHIREQQLHQSS